MSLKMKMAEQFRKPHGFFGKIIGALMKRFNHNEILWTISKLEIKSTDHILEIGYGPGTGIQKTAELASHGFVAGIDFSDNMHRNASKLNAHAISEGRVELKLGDALHLPFNNNIFNRVYMINVIYFWDDVVSHMIEIRRVMQAGGKLAIFMARPEALGRIKCTQTPIFNSYSLSQIQEFLSDSGYVNINVFEKQFSPGPCLCIICEKGSG